MGALQVPGGYQDSLSSNTELGRAVQSACAELDTLATLEQEQLCKANDLLKQIGYKGNLFQSKVAQDQNESEGTSEVNSRS